MTGNIRRGLGLLLLGVIAWGLGQLALNGDGAVAAWGNFAGYALAALLAAAGLVLLLLGLLRD